MDLQNREKKNKGLNEFAWKSVAGVKPAWKIMVLNGVLLLLSHL